jgi:hypothetical protein
MDRTRMTETIFGSKPQFGREMEKSHCLEYLENNSERSRGTD